MEESITSILTRPIRLIDKNHAWMSIIDPISGLVQLIKSIPSDIVIGNESIDYLLNQLPPI